MRQRKTITKESIHMSINWMQKINKGVCHLEESLFKFDEFWGQMDHLDILCLFLEKVTLKKP